MVDVPSVGSIPPKNALKSVQLYGSTTDIYFQVVTVYTNTAVTDTIGQQYGFLSDSILLSHDGAYTIDFPITERWPSYQAIWIFEDIRNTWNYVYNHDFRNGVPYDPGSVTAEWEEGLECYLSICNSITWAPEIGPHFIFITDFNNTNSMDTVMHETGHMFMFNANKWWYSDSSCWYHSMFTSINTNCAWSEGWADFFPMVVNGDHCYNIMAVNPCAGLVDINYYNLEDHNRTDNPNNFSFGDTVEGRVAATLYDLYDFNHEGYDREGASFFPISQIALGSSQVTTFQNFWNDWISTGQDQFLSGLTLWWNTINYINILWTFLPITMK
jgi:hypothetical protein